MATRSSRSRSLRRGLVALLAVGAVVGAGELVRRKYSEETAVPVAAAEVLKAATVTIGDLSTTERLSGSVVLSDTTDVLNRTPTSTSTSSGASASQAAATNQSTTAAASNFVAAAVPEQAGGTADCTTDSTVPSAPPASEPVAPTTTTTVEPPTTTTDPSAPPSTTITETTVASTVTEPTVASTVPATTAPCTPTSTPGGSVAGGFGGAGGSGAVAGSGGGTSSGGATSVTAQTVTSIRSVGQTVELGDVLYTVDGLPVIALAGSIPAWRAMSTSSPNGADVWQLEASLAALGYDSGGAMVVDADFDSHTATVVKAWQKGNGVEETGTVELGSVVFLTPGTTIISVNKGVGDSVRDGDGMLSVSADSQEVVIDVPTGSEREIVPGGVVDIDGTAGTVTRLRSSSDSGSVAVQAVIVPQTPLAGATNGSTVTVRLTITEATGVLTVPVEAIASRIDGNHVVEVRAADGTTTWVPIELLGVSGNMAAIRGDGVGEGTTVLLPV